jgi:group I intron endonuclease
LEILEHCSKEEVTLREQFYLDTLKPTYNILKLAGSSLGFKHYYSTIVQIKERNNKNHPFLGREHSKESKLKMSLSSRLSSPVKLLDLETGKEKLFNSNVQAANFLNISE